MLLTKKTAFITGGSRGIGQAIVQRYLEEGANVYYYSRKKSVDHALLADTAQSKSLTLQHCEGDVTDTQTLQAAIKLAKETEGTLDVIVNNAGITRDKLFIGMNKDDWDTVLETNLSSIFYSLQTAVPIMLKQRSGVIINISSIVGINGNPGQVNYCASKAGIIGLTKSLALELAKKNVRVNVIAPGFIATDMTNSIAEEYQQKIIEQIPMRRVGQAKEIADSCVFFASDLSSYITGQVLVVSGGLGG